MRSLDEAMALAELWTKSPFDDDTALRVKALLLLPPPERERAILDRFGYDLEFGTAGMRALMDVGTARINPYTIARVSRAVARVLMSRQKAAPVVVIGYDARRHSASFARIAARAFAQERVRVIRFTKIVPTPLVPFTVRRLQADCGVVITSSHNPPDYNGFKVYAANGAQIISPFDREVMAEMQALPFALPEDDGGEFITEAEEGLVRDYIDWVTRETDFSDPKKRTTKIVFTPLHGAAGAVARAAFYRAGFTNFLTVPEQTEPNPAFPTVKAPNPEIPESLDLAMALAKREEAAVVLATDGDGDRVGIAYRAADGSFVRLSGNQIGCVLLFYLLSKLRAQGKIEPTLFAIASVVSTPLARRIAEKFGITYYETLTGFKNMGNKAEAVIRENPKAKLVMAFEEAFGVTVGDSRDKDGIVSNLLAAHAAADGGIAHWLESLYRECGYAAEDAAELEFPGALGIAAMQGVMEKLRQNPPLEILGEKVVVLRDFLKQTEMRDGTTFAINHVPPQNLLWFANQRMDWLAIRPSGTEPKIKAYFGAVLDNYSEAAVAEAQARLRELRRLAERLLAVG